jgi:hypothetical protein
MVVRPAVYYPDLENINLVNIIQLVVARHRQLFQPIEAELHVPQTLNALTLRREFVAKVDFVVDLVVVGRG